MSAEQPAATPITVMVYSDDRNTRQQVRLALGKRVARDLPAIEVVETATAPMLLRAAHDGGIDMFVLDAESVPVGGMGLSHQLHDELANCPPVLLLVARRDDAWLASWSQAEAISGYPIDPVRLPDEVAKVIRTYVLPAEPVDETAARA